MSRHSTPPQNPWGLTKSCLKRPHSRNPHFMCEPFVLLSGGAAGSVITFIWTGCREKKRRRSVFRGFLGRWKVEVSAQHRSAKVVRAVVDQAVIDYDAKLGAFHEHVSIVRDDFSSSQRFADLTTRLGGLTPQDWKDKPREVI